MIGKLIERIVAVLTFVIALCPVFLFPNQLCAAQATQEETLHIAVAANFAKPVKAISEEFETRSGVHAIITVASSGTLYAQIKSGAPFDVFLSADAERPLQLVEDGLVASSAVKTYAVGRLAYLSRSLAEPAIDDLKTAALAPNEKLAIANPRLAPYGLAAQQTLLKLALWQQMLPSLVYGKNILQAYQYYISGNVDNALVAWSLIKDRSSHVVLIPEHYHEPIVQKMAVMKAAAHPEAAARFMEYLLSPKVQKSLDDWGYGQALDTPGESLGN
ncbi:molybdate ABC transporter substrate-binding protein [Alteromonas pelagimontana]|uniref:Molybdate ABC transporter substrate-binding protein n=1 Tax=Alteromonas pelagimontana TaxID=1858656 RepID=A0A6M4MGZ1_9ALTE|nr:molybdate ABC transporter substrate-binding protein [Alteromonas pelagimontana]QJR82343.1 molybdate ABC transporter substrate-binding protein [Alteromonas pelagimontana]